MTDDGRCEICGEVVGHGATVVRMHAELGYAGRPGLHPKLSEVISMAAFHLECVESTMSSRECDVVNYIDNAREIVSLLEEKTKAGA